MSEPTAAGSNRWEQYSEAGRVLLSRGDQARAAEAFAAAARAAEREFGGESLQLAASLSALGQLCYQRREHAAAAEHFTRALGIRERALGADHLGVAQSVNNLAAVCVARDDFAGAEPLLQRALAITERHRGRKHPDLAVGLNNLAKLHFKRGDLAAAEPLLTRLLEIKRGQDARNPEVATVLASLATLKQATGEHVPAMRYWREALAMREESASPTDGALAPLLENLSDCCFVVGQRSEALALRQRALGIREHALGADHPSVIAARSRVVALRQEMNRAVGIGGPAAGAASLPARATPREARLSMLHLSPIDASPPPPGVPLRPPSVTTGASTPAAVATGPRVAQPAPPSTAPSSVTAATKAPASAPAPAASLLPASAPAIAAAPPAQPAPPATAATGSVATAPATRESAGSAPSAPLSPPPTAPHAKEPRRATPLPAARSVATEDAVWWTPTAPPESAPAPTPAAAALPPALAAAPAPAPVTSPVSPRRTHPSDEIEAVHLPPAATASGARPEPVGRGSRAPVEVHIDRSARSEARAASARAARSPLARRRARRIWGGDRLFVGLGLAAAVIGAAAYLAATRGPSLRTALDVVATIRSAPAAQPSTDPTESVAHSSTVPAPALAAPAQPVTSQIVARSATPLSNVPTGPVVAPLPSTGRAAAHRDGAARSADTTAPSVPRLRTIRLDAVTRDIEAKAAKGVDDATRVQVKQTFKQP